MALAEQQLLQAMLLLGPTGSGKTPLGDWLAEHGLQGRRCQHFDFGANLRSVVAGGVTASFGIDEIEFLKGVLERGVLLEAESFYIAEKILDGYVKEHGVTPEDWFVLNGLPRHVGQAEALSKRLAVRAVVRLLGEPAVVRERLRRNSGGDRHARLDDTDELIARKLAIYEQRTRPLLDYYRQRGAHLISVSVGVETQARAMAAQIERWL